MTIAGYLLVGFLAGLVLLGFLCALKARSAIAAKLRADGRRVLRMRGKLFRSPFATGLSPLAFVYRVTTQAPDEDAKTKLYAYDPGAWFSRHEAHVRQYSGGVWRNA